MTIKIGINGFGRIGRNVFRAALGRSEVAVTAVNDLTDAHTLAHLLKYDSVHGILNAEIQVGVDNFSVAGQRVQVLAQREPDKLPWGELGIDYVLESTGRFTSRETAAAHLTAGAQKVVISAPGKDVDATFVLGVNQEQYDPKKHHVISNASCTTNCLAPLVKVLHDAFGIQEGLMSTVHSYTNDQQILDLPHKDLRRARAAGLSIIPTSTGAAKAVGLVIPELAGKLNGLSLRVPTPNVSLMDFVAVLENSATREQINQIFAEKAAGELTGILGYSDAPLVSRDYYGDARSCIIDSLATMVQQNSRLVKVLAWYDNEWAYSCRTLDLLLYMRQRDEGADPETAFARLHT